MARARVPDRPALSVARVAACLSSRHMAEDILADLMGSFLIVAPAVFGMIFAYWLFKKVRLQRSQRPKIDPSRFERCRRSLAFALDDR